MRKNHLTLQIVILLSFLYSRAVYSAEIMFPNGDAFLVEVTEESHILRTELGFLSVGKEKIANGSHVIYREGNPARLSPFRGQRTVSNFGKRSSPTEDRVIMTRKEFKNCANK